MSTKSNSNMGDKIPSSRATGLSSAKSLTVIAMLCTLAYVIMVVGRVPMVMFLKYDPKDVVIAIGALIWGPAYGIITSVVVSLVEMITVSNDGFIGLLMNILSTLAFVLPASIIYGRVHNMKGALIGLFTGLIMMTAIMILWNYIITPYYMGIPRTEVVKLLVPAILPFNLIKGGLNLGFTLLLYKPLVKALRKSGLAPASADSEVHTTNWGVLALASIVLISCLIVALVIRGAI